MKLAYEQLPPGVQHAIRNVLQHRRDIVESVRARAKPVGYLVLPLSLINYMAVSLVKGKPLSWQAYAGSTAMITLGLTYGLFLDHNRGFRKEYLGLFNALRGIPSDSPLHRLLSSRGANYIIVRNNGNIETRRFAPKVIGLPIGRRAVINPLAPPHKIQKWKRKYLRVRKQP